MESMNGVEPYPMNGVEPHQYTFFSSVHSTLFLFSIAVSFFVPYSVHGPYLLPLQYQLSHQERLYC